MASDTITLLASFPADFFINWKDDVVSVRNLYRERKYRRCAVLCSEFLKEAVSQSMSTIPPQHSKSIRYTQSTEPSYTSTKPSVTKVLVTSPITIRATRFFFSNRHETHSCWPVKACSCYVCPQIMADLERLILHQYVQQWI